MLMDKLNTALENSEMVISIFLKFSKAFDTLDHKILLSKLFHYGIRGVVHSWFTSYLSNRKQYATYNGTYSATKNIIYGVPQGSNFGPLLYLAYIDDLCDVCKFIVYFLQMTQICSAVFLISKHWKQISTKNLQKSQNA